jgi:hypothetical protein
MTFLGLNKKGHLSLLKKQLRIWVLLAIVLFFQ